MVRAEFKDEPVYRISRHSGLDHVHQRIQRPRRQLPGAVHAFKSF